MSSVDPAKVDPANWPVFVNGALRSSAEPVLSCQDQGFTLGLAVFDSLVFDGGVCLFLEEHLERLQRGARGVGIVWPAPWDVRAALLQVAHAIGADPIILRTTYSRGVPGAGPTLVVNARPVVVPPQAGVRVFVPAYRMVADPAIDGLKTTNRLRNVLMREQAFEHGAFEALLVDTRGRVLEGTISNAWARFGDELRTAPLEIGCLGGITRAQILDSLRADPLPSKPLKNPGGHSASGEHGQEDIRVREAPFTLAELPEADELFMTNSSGRAFGVTHVSGPAIEDVDLPGSVGWAVSNVAKRLAQRESAYRARTKHS